MKFLAPVGQLCIRTPLIKLCTRYPKNRFQIPDLLLDEEIWKVSGIAMQSLRDCVSENEYTNWKKMLKNSLSFETKMGPVPIFVALYESFKKGVFGDFYSIIMKKKKDNVDFTKDFRKLKNDFQKRILISCQMTFPLVLFKEVYDHKFLIIYAVFFSLIITLSWMYIYETDENLNYIQQESNKVVEK